MTAPRPFYWSVRRELWEHRAITLAPLIAAGVVLFGYLVSLIHPTRLPPMRGGSSEAAASMRMWIASPAAPFDFASWIVILTTLIVGVFYCVGALQGERGDRSILFWRSLPVSDLTSVLAKAAVPMIVLPLVAFAVAMATRLVMLALGTAALMASGGDPSGLWAAAVSPARALALIYSFATDTLWAAPVWTWLLLVSGWARRMPIVWAIGLPLAPCIVERIGFGSSRLFGLLGERLVGASAIAFDVPSKGGPAISLAQADPARFLSTPGLWIGLTFAAAFLTAAVWLRRHREPN